MTTKTKIGFDPNIPLAKENAIFAVELAAMAYKTKPEIEQRLDDLGFKDEMVAFIQTRLYSCFVIRCDDVTAIAFKGTKNWREQLNNLNVWPQATSHGRIHSGFLYTMNRLGPLLYKLIYGDILSGRKILLTGHSRGGALAQVFASMLVIAGHVPHSVWAFGSPMTGDATFASLLANIPVTIFQNVSDNGSDQIPLFPPNVSPSGPFTKWILGFRAVFIPVVLTRYVGIIVPPYLSRLGKGLFRWLINSRPPA
jgi:hypothetical protein